MAASLGLIILVVLFALVYFSPRHPDSAPGVTPVSAADPTPTPEVAEAVVPQPSRASPPADTGTVSNLVARAVAATLHTKSRRSPAGPAATPGPTDAIPTPSPSDTAMPTPTPEPIPSDLPPTPTPEPSPTETILPDPIPSVSPEPSLFP